MAKGKLQKSKGERGFMNEIQKRPSIPTSHKAFNWRGKQNGKPNKPIESGGVIQKGVSGKALNNRNEKLADSSVPFHKRKEIKDVET